MSIVKMKRLRAVAMGSEQDALLAALQRLGCVQIDAPDRDDPRWAALTTADSALLEACKDQISSLESALDTLNKYAKAKGGFLSPRPELTEQSLFDDAVKTAALEAAQAIREEEGRMSALRRESVKLQSQRRTLAPWLDLNVSLDVSDTKAVTFTFAALPAQADYAAARAALEEASPLCQLFPGGRDREFQYLLLVCHRSGEDLAREALRPFGFSRVPLKGWTGSARENDSAIARRLEAIETERTQAAAAIAAQSGQRESIRRTIDRLRQDAAREEAKSRLLQSENALFLEGWVPADQAGRLGEVLRAFTCAWETEDPVKDDYPQVPVKLKNNVVTRPLNMVTEMYSLPAYNGIDPNPLIMPFFVFFFGFMFADLGYGLILAGFALLVLHRAKPKGTMRYMMGLMLECGIASAVIGFFTGGFFSDAIAAVSILLGKPEPSIPFLTQDPLLDVVNDPMTVLIFCMAIGFIQLVVGMAANAYILLREGNWKDAFFDVFTWWLVFGGLAVLVVAGSPTLLIVSGILLALGAVVRTEFPFGRGILSGLLIGLARSAAALLGTLYNNVTGYFGDILSYSRLMVMMLAGAVIGSIFNLLGTMPGNVIVFAVVFVIGHLFNIGLNVIGTYVHASRLQYLEFFGKFYREGGRPFRPLNLSTKYVDIKEDT